jgi:hypothetical protein
LIYKKNKKEKEKGNKKREKRFFEYIAKYRAGCGALFYFDFLSPR